MKCRRCGAKAVVKLRAHNSAFCPQCFFVFFRRQVEKAIRSWRMFERDERVMIAVSGGKDSLALWDVLDGLGYRTCGIHLCLGIGEYSKRSRQKAEKFASERGLELIVVETESRCAGLGVPELAAAAGRSPCAACGTVKRHLFDTEATRRGCKVLATGHNLDDEAARLLGNVLRWQRHYLAKQKPVLEATEPGFPRKVKPLYRISELATATYAFLRKIDYVVEECPKAKGATQLVYKEALNQLERAVPGTKFAFVSGFLDVREECFGGEREAGAGRCESCGQPCAERLCSFCRLVARAAGKPKVASGL